MGKYTQLADKYRDRGPQVEEGSSVNINNVKINNIDSNRDVVIDKPTSEGPEDTVEGSSPVDSLQSRSSGHNRDEHPADSGPTRLRPTTLTTLSRSYDIVPGAGAEDTNLRTTNLTNLVEPGEEYEERWHLLPQEGKYRALVRRFKEAEEKRSVQCIHDLTQEDCAVCSGYVKWLIADESRLRRAQRDLEGVRREFWLDVRGEA
jgi:hypothetical protein